MIYIDVKGKWEIIVFTNKDSNRMLIKYLEQIGCSDNDIHKALEITESVNSGFTYTNPKTSIVYISDATSKSEWFNTLVHEIKHVQSHICDYYDVKENGEEAAYLIGYIMKKIMQWLM